MKETNENQTTKPTDTIAFRKAKITEYTEEIKAYNTAQSTWGKRNYDGVLHSTNYEEYFPDLIITNSTSNKAIDPIIATIFDSQETLTIGVFIIPKQFDETNTQEQFIDNFENFRHQYDAILLMTEDSNFTDFGFKEIIPNSENTAMTHYRNSCFDFQSFKNVFAPKNIVFMRTALGSGSTKAIEAIQSAFAIPAFYRNQIAVLKDSILCVKSGTDQYTIDEINLVCNYSLDQIKTGATLVHDTFEDNSLGNTIRASVFISGFDSLD